MLDAIRIMIDGVWSLLCISIPISSTISFTLWQYSFFIILVTVTVKYLYKQAYDGGGK